ncbi:hypothetical protein AVEN_201767-1 [Araneus ventricosus]|uniref:Uncharacterized protein n=1 Tax=Araneus ventricosus TaxID=182803 RepID=A0A4Y2IZT1_ARAVE|nr:hypothetical protein AVEN_201767-1 [Araneus ventricosus]
MTTPELTSPSRLATTYDLAYTADVQWRRVSSLNPSCSGAETLPLGHRVSEKRNMVITHVIAQQHLVFQMKLLPFSS